jgi:hypothetical protein
MVKGFPGQLQHGARSIGRHDSSTLPALCSCSVACFQMMATAALKHTSKHTKALFQMVRPAYDGCAVGVHAALKVGVPCYPYIKGPLPQPHAREHHTVSLRSSLSLSHAALILSAAQ